MITDFKIFEKNEHNSEFKIHDYVIADYKEEGNDIGLYKVSNIKYVQNSVYFYMLFDVVNDKKIDGWFIEFDLRFANQVEIDDAEILKNAKKYNI